MKVKIIAPVIIIALLFTIGCTQNQNITNNSEVKLGNLTIKFFGHASFEIIGSKIIYIDPFVLPENAIKADYILITHNHFDHCAVDNAKKLQMNDTRIIGTMDCVTKLTGKTNSIAPGEYFIYPDGVRIDAVEAYNINKLQHPKGFGVGFVITIDGKKIYHAGDTDKIPEMINLTGIDVALLPIGGTFTMDVNEAAEAAKMFKPKIVIPMHYNSGKYGINGIDADLGKLNDLLKDSGIEIKILKPLG
jgi:L-ascorbate metabolism protein UlaG (beta-lactamase superfamily)